VSRFARDALAVALLVGLGLLAFWRLLTPDVRNQQSFAAGDFSGQFVAFAAHQARELHAGRLALWNPWNRAGHPFLADPQSASLYPPRLLGLRVLGLTGPLTPARLYLALELEVIAHTLLAALLSYGLLRRLEPTAPRAGSVLGAAIFGFGGYLSGYPQLQVAILDSVAWWPLLLLAVHEATRDPPRPRWLSAGGATLALCLLAGHPQTVFQGTLFALGYLGWRRRHQPLRGVREAGWLLLVGFGLSALQWLPSWEYARATSRASLDFETAGHGFPFRDLLQFLFPGLLSVWSPLYVGLVGATLASAALLRRASDAGFWAGSALVALLASFGAATPLFDLLYLGLPGYQLFRGQERAAAVVSLSLAVLAAKGAGVLFAARPPGRALPRGLVFGVPLVCLGVALTLFVRSLAEGSAFTRAHDVAALALLVACLQAVLLLRLPTRATQAGIVALVAIELLAAARMAPNRESIPVSARLQETPIVRALRPATAAAQRVDAALGLGDNYGTLFGIMDVRGTSPLQFVALERLLALPRARAWELLAVRYVVSQERSLPVRARVVALEGRAAATLRVHELEDAGPFARIVFEGRSVDGSDAAFAALAEPRFNPRRTAILEAAAPLALAGQGQGRVLSVAIGSDQVEIAVETADPGLLVVALVAAPGWQARVDGVATPLVRANGALSAVPVTPGRHRVRFAYCPASLLWGLGISLLSAAALTARLWTT
jgi:Bacterial membrane protein YfhO